MKQEIRKLIQEYKDQEFDRDFQRFELLSRNKHFLNELEDLQKIFSDYGFFRIRNSAGDSKVFEDADKLIYEKGYPKLDLIRNHHGFTKEQWDELDDFTREGLRGSFETRLILLWSEFCDRWNIKVRWDGEIGSLKKYIKPPIHIRYFKEEDGAAAIVIFLDNWTVLEDVRKAWNIIEGYQNKLWLKKESLSRFKRDLLWYSLSREHGLTTSEISKIWSEHFPEEIDLLVIRRMKGKIAENDRKGRAMEDSELLDSVKDGFLSKKYKKEFEKQRKYYLTGKFEGGKKYAPFNEVIKSAIPRLEKKMSEINYYIPPESFSSPPFIKKALKKL